MRYTLIHRHTGEWHHKDDYDISNENRILDEYRADTTFTEMCEFLTEQAKFIDDKKHGDLLIPAEFVGKDEDFLPATQGVYEDGEVVDRKVRTNSSGEMFVGRYAPNIKTLCCFPLDVDGGMRVEEAQERFSDYEYFLHTSYSHMNDGSTHNFRMFFEYETPLTREQYVERRTALFLHFGGKEVIDVTTTYLARGFYTLGFNKDYANHIVVEHNSGKKLDALAFKASKPVPYEGKPSDNTMTDNEKSEILDHLRTTRIDTYEGFWWMISAMKSAGYSLQDCLYVSADNPMHASNKTGIKSKQLIKSTYDGFNEVNDRAVGKLITIIRNTHPEFRKKKSYEDNLNELKLNIKKWR